jgi:hypothetical protein
MVKRMRGVELRQVVSEAGSCFVAGVFAKALSEFLQIEVSPDSTAMHAGVRTLVNSASNDAAEELCPAGGVKIVGLEEAAVRVFAAVETAFHDTGIVAERAQIGRIHRAGLRHGATGVKWWL